MIKWNRDKRVWVLKGCMRGEVVDVRLRYLVTARMTWAKNWCVGPVFIRPISLAASPSHGCHVFLTSARASVGIRNMPTAHAQS